MRSLCHLFQLTTFLLISSIHTEPAVALTKVPDENTLESIILQNDYTIQFTIATCVGEEWKRGRRFASLDKIDTLDRWQYQSSCL